MSSDWALGMAQAVADGARFPPLILVTAGPSGNLVVLEGHARLTAYMLCRPVAAGTGGAGRLVAGHGRLGPVGRVWLGPRLRAVGLAWVRDYVRSFERCEANEIADS